MLKRAISCLLCTVLLLSLLPAGVLAAEDGPETAVLSGSANRPAAAESPEAEGGAGPAAAPDGTDPDGVWTAIRALEREKLPARPAVADYESLLPQVEALVTARDDYVPGSAVWRDGALLWRTHDGNAWGYNPYLQSAVNSAVPMTGEERAAAERGLPAQATAEETAALMSGSADSRDVAVFIPWWGKDVNFGLHLYYTGLQLAAATGGGCRLYLGEEATIDAIADALTSCCAVFINTHGAPGEITLTTDEGLTQEDRDGGHGWRSISSTIVDGQCIVNHLRGRTVTAEFVSLNACACMGSDGLAKPLREAGVDLVFGYSKNSTCGPCERFTRYFVEGIVQGMTAAKASVYMKQQMARWVLDEHMTFNENIIAMLEETGMMYWNIWRGGGAVTAEEARANGADFPIFVSEQDPYPGADHVDEIQTVRSTWKLSLDPASSKNIRAWGKTGAYFAASFPDVFTNKDVSGITLTGGELPPGIIIEKIFETKDYYIGIPVIVNAACLYGTPTRTGLYEAQLLVEFENGTKETRTASILIVSEPFARTEQNVVAGTGKDRTILFTDGHEGDIFLVERKSGRVPPGMTFLSDGGKLRYCGVPDQTGTFTAVYRIIMTSGKVIEHTVSVTVPARFKETSESLGIRKGTEGTVLLGFDGADQVGVAEQISGQLPPGMTFGCSMSEKPRYAGKPTSNGTWTAVFRFFLLDGTLLTHTVTATVYSETASIDVYSMDLSLGETTIPKADMETWLERTFACAESAGQISMSPDHSRFDLDRDGTWDVSVTRESGNAVFRLLPESSLTGDDFILTLNQDALDKADLRGTEDPSAGYAKVLSFHLNTDYDLYITGTQVTSRNRTDIKGNGVFSFDGINTLVVRGDCSYYASKPVIRNGIDGLTVRTEEDSVLTSWTNCIETKGSLSLTGTGQLSLNSQNGSGIVCENALLEIYNTNLTIQAKEKGVTGTGSGAVHARLSRADVTIRSGEGAMDGFWSIGLTNCLVTDPMRGDKGIIGGLTCLVSGENELLTDARITAYGKKYDLMIDGVQVTDLNREDVLGNGTFFFDGDRTLIVYDSYESAKYAVIDSNIGGLMIQAAPDTVLRTGGRTCVSLGGNTVLTGGPLTVITEGRLLSRGINIRNDSWLYVSEMDLTVRGGQHGIDGGAGEDQNKLDIRASNVTVSGTAAAVRIPGGLELEQCLLEEPEGGAFREADGLAVDAGGETAREVAIRSFRTWELYLCGVQVTDRNMGDILGDGTFSFDGYKTLTVRGNCTGEGDIIESYIPGLILSVEKDSTLKTGEYGDPVFTWTDLTVTGPGKLTLISGCTAAVNIKGGAALTLRDADVAAQGPCGLWGGEDVILTVENASVTARGATGAVQDFAGGITLAGCGIAAPAGAGIENGAVVTAEGTAAKEVAVAPAKITVSGDTLTYRIFLPGSGEPARLMAAWYDGSGRMTGCEGAETARDGMKTGTITVRKDQKEYRLFALDENGRPLTAALSAAG